MIEIRDSIERLPIDALVPYARNSRTHSEQQVAQIAASMREWGWTNPVLVDEAGGIIAGHGRVMAAKSLGQKEVPVIVLRGLSDAQKRAYVIADNKLALNAGWDDEMLKLEMTDPDDSPDVSTAARVQPGDVFVMGKHRLLCGDSTSAADVARLCNERAVDMWLTDPPYNVAYEGKTKDALKIQNDSMGKDAFREFLAGAYKAANEVMKPGAVFYIWHADSEGYNFRGAANDAGWTVRQCLVWKKQTLVMGRQDYHWKHEPCLYGWKDGAGHLWASDRKQTTILEFDRPSRNGEHPTMKPVALFEYQMLNNTKGGDIVLDSFGGSGTTMIAAEKNGRVAYLMELDPRYCDVIIKRWQDYTGAKAVREADGVAFDDLEAH